MLPKYAEKTHLQPSNTSVRVHWSHPGNPRVTPQPSELWDKCGQTLWFPSKHHSELQIASGRYLSAPALLASGKAKKKPPGYGAALLFWQRDKKRPSQSPGEGAGSRRSGQIPLMKASQRLPQSPPCSCERLRALQSTPAQSSFVGNLPTAHFPGLLIISFIGV